MHNYWWETLYIEMYYATGYELILQQGKNIKQVENLYHLQKHTKIDHF